MLCLGQISSIAPLSLVITSGDLAIFTLSVGIHLTSRELVTRRYGTGSHAVCCINRGANTAQPMTSNPRNVLYTMVDNQTSRDKAFRQKGNSPEQAVRSLRTTE